jgi:tetratricopeptide (TPR) repeat protein
VPMKEAGLDWFYDAFPWANGKSVITTRASEWAQDAVCRGDGVDTQWGDGTSVGSGGTEEGGGAQGCSRDGGRPSGSAQVGSFEEDEAYEWVTGKVPKWLATATSVLDLVRFLHCFPLAVAQAAEYARICHTETPEELQQELVRTGLELRKGRRMTKKDEYPECFPAVVKLSLMKILQSEEPDAEDAGHALRKLALVGTSAIPIDLLTPTEKNAVYLLQEHSLVTVDEMRLAAMHALTQLVVRDQLTTRVQRPALLATLASVLEVKLGKFDPDKPSTYFIGRRYAQHASTLVQHAREWGALPAALARGGAGDSGAGGRGADSSAGLWTSVGRFCFKCGSFFLVVSHQYQEAHCMFAASLACTVALRGDDHPDVAASFINIGAVYAGKGDNENALVQYQKGLEIQTRVFGSDHPDVAASFYNIGAVYEGKGDIDNALVQFQTALEIRTRVFGSDHPDVAVSYANLAAVYQTQGNHVQRKEMVTRAYHIFLKVLGPDHPQTQGLKPFVDE